MRTRIDPTEVNWPWRGSEVVLTLVGGEVIVGYFGARSVIGGDQAHPDIYLERVLDPPPPPGLQSDGIWVSGDRVSRIEIRNIGAA